MEVIITIMLKEEEDRIDDPFLMLLYTTKYTM